MSAQNVLLTGASSFTGYWFVRALAEAGHQVTAAFTRRHLAAYGDDLRSLRVQQLQDYCQPVFNCSFGDDRFLQLAKTSAPNVFCHHGADVTNYRSADFDACQAVTKNTHRVRQVLERLSEVDCNKIVLTGTVFEGGEGAGSDGLPHFSAYGLSKSLTAAVFRHYCREAGFSLGKFVIPNPFGPYEEPRFTAYLVRCWAAGETPCVQTPTYIRDNIHVTLLAKHYAEFVTQFTDSEGDRQTNPSGYIESQGAFAQRFAHELGTRLDLPCPVDLAVQTEYPEPRVRINTEPVAATTRGWREATAWDELADYYAPIAIARS